MTVQALEFVSLSDRERREIDRLPPLGEAETLKVQVQTQSGEQTIALPPRAQALIETLLEHLVRGEPVTVLAEDAEVTPNDAAAILGMSRPLVVHRMEIGDLPFRYVGKHRRARLADVLALKAKLEAQRAALRALADDTEELARDHGL
ncbi:MAG: DNA-binding protein [Pseudomonadota bacterium]